MRKILRVGALLLGSAFFASPAFAQSYVKSNDDQALMNQTQRSDAEDYLRAPVRQSESGTLRVDTIEPAAGDEGRNRFADFTGPYIGGDIGYNIGSHDVSGPGGLDGDAGLDGFEGGVFAGYGYTHDFDWLGGYAGIEIGYEWSGADGDIGGAGFEKDHAWVATFRPGVTVSEDALGYGIVGYSRAEFEGNGADDSVNGLILGAGTEFNTRTPLKIRMEYTYTNYDEADFSGTDFEGHENNVKLGAVFRF